MLINDYSRRSHVGKTRKELSDYQSFIRGTGKIEGTIENPEEITLTDDSSVEDEPVTKPPKIRQQAGISKLRSFFFGDLPKSIISSLTITVILAFFGLLISNIKLEAKIDNFDINVKEVKERFTKLEEKLNEMSIFKTSVDKDLEFIKIWIGF